jgi:hypothetical protein
MDTMHVEQIANGQLDSGERLLWAGRPAPLGVALGSLPMTVFGLLFGGFAAFWIWAASGGMSRSSDGAFSGPGAFFPLFGLPFLLVGLGMVFAPLWAYLGAKNMVYAVTDRRAMIIAGLRTKNVRSFTKEEIGEITRIERPDGSGSLMFASVTRASSKGQISVSRVGFEGIPDVRRVEQLIRDNLDRRAA